MVKFRKSSLKVLTATPSLKTIKSGDTSPAVSTATPGVMCKQPLALLDSTTKNDECLSPMGRNEATFDFNVK
jgi:hypothetical protein